jgi:hypothetical protein
LSSGFWFKSHTVIRSKRGEKDEERDWVHHISETRVACRHGTVQYTQDITGSPLPTRFEKGQLVALNKTQRERCYQ